MDFVTKMSDLSIWYYVFFTDEKIIRDVHPPNIGAWKDHLYWKDIIRVCYKTGDFLETDEIYIFTNQRKESYVIPVEARGGTELWGEILARKLFPAELSIKLSSDPTSNIYCWPPPDNN
jgi:hypothetical protein